jgi:GDPmannose 4,6-dehydratase
LGITIRWEGENEKEIGIVDSVVDKGLGLAVDRLLGKTIVQVDPRYYRPTEVESLLGDPTKAKEKLGWEPTITFEQMVQEMVSVDLDKAKRFALLKDKGFELSLTEEQ